MKTLTIPITEIKNGIFDFQPNKQFRAEWWCLDLHGFLSRNGFKERLDKINLHIQEYPLMSEKMKNKLYWISGPDYSAASTGTITVEALIAGLTFLAKYMIDQKADELAKNFEKNLKLLLAEYNNQDNPTANWKFVWRSVLSHISFEVNSISKGSIKGKAVPKYVEQAEIVLEISDALSTLTANTVRVNQEITMITDFEGITTSN
ncbi:tetratricopeptide repeat protein 40 [Gigaspora margarita]|uniref:Tetratricopeptide repeat protein 40 n=1 Tax=Gigaspora margarita TaxID=4874 RepID=A0A8H4B097_GIGMA|nr:tetratricopeptide repeat protein 40 [Gigaspora margarita]